jgi:hypothetical protein
LSESTAMSASIPGAIFQMSFSRNIP